MIKIAAAVSGAALLIGAILPLPGMTNTATTGISLQNVNTAAKGDRLDARQLGPGCNERGWPYYEPNCLYGTNSVSKPVRIVTTDRLPAHIRFATSN
jgi:hypothetical protein